MLLRAFTIFDTKTETFSQPFFAVNRGAAIRMFQDTVNDPSTMFNRHPEDYHLFEIGEFDDATASFQTEHPQSLGPASQFKENVQ